MISSGVGEKWESTAIIGFRKNLKKSFTAKNTKAAEEEKSLTAQGR
jgi:hypothetical protein